MWIRFDAGRGLTNLAKNCEVICNLWFVVGSKFYPNGVYIIFKNIAHLVFVEFRQTFNLLPFNVSPYIYESTIRIRDSIPIDLTGCLPIPRRASASGCVRALLGDGSGPEAGRYMFRFECLFIRIAERHT